MHLVKDEQALFPYISRMEEAARGVPFPRPMCGTVENPVRMMVLEHDNAGAARHKMQELGADYQPPPDACNTYRALYEKHDNYWNGYRRRGINFFGLGRIGLKVPRDRKGEFESAWLPERKGQDAELEA
ncbi:MAG: transposase, partial [Terriglobia bacterium]